MATLPAVLVIGAGVIGLSTAVTLAEAGYPVVVRTAEPSEATTSAVAGALWGPWLVEPRHRVLRWAEHTLTINCAGLGAHHRSDQHRQAGWPAVVTSLGTGLDAPLQPVAHQRTVYGPVETA